MPFYGYETLGCELVLGSGGILLGKGLRFCLGHSGLGGGVDVGNRGCQICSAGAGVFDDAEISVTVGFAMISETGARYTRRR